VKPTPPSFSIVTPTLNAEPFIAHCIASIRDQGVGEVEHLIVDGGSSDNTLAVARQHSGSVLVERPGQNQSQAINTGLRLASGDVVAWLNADDCYARGALMLVSERFDASPGLDAVYGDCDVVDENSKLLWRETPGPYDYQRLLRRGNYLAQPSVFLRKDLLKRVGFLDESLEYAMDYDMWLRLRDARIEYIPRVLAVFRWHPTSKTARNQIGNWREILRIVRRQGGGWTAPLVWSYARARLTLTRQSVVERVWRGR
jgi:glycosyltransferase involved in cell wall biosynthesis